MVIFIFYNRIVMCVDPVLDRIILSLDVNEVHGEVFKCSQNLNVWGQIISHNLYENFHHLF